MSIFSLLYLRTCLTTNTGMAGKLVTLQLTSSSLEWLLQKCSLHVFWNEWSSLERRVREKRCKDLATAGKLPATVPSRHCRVNTAACLGFPKSMFIVMISKIFESMDGSERRNDEIICVSTTQFVSYKCCKLNASILFSTCRHC
jgi:hypothetical protein